MFKKLIIGSLLNLYLSIGICHSYDFENQANDCVNTLRDIGYSKETIYFTKDNIEVLTNPDFNVKDGFSAEAKNGKNYLKNVVLETIKLFTDKDTEAKKASFLAAFDKVSSLRKDGEIQFTNNDTGFNLEIQDSSKEVERTAKLFFAALTADAKIDEELIHIEKIAVNPPEDIFILGDNKKEDKDEALLTETKNLLKRAIILNIDKEKVPSLLEELDASENKGSFLNKIDSERFGNKKDKTLLQKVDNRFEKHQDGGEYHLYSLKTDEQIGAFHGFLKEAKVPQKPYFPPSQEQTDAVKLVQDIIGLYDKRILKSSEDNLIRKNLFNKEGIELIFKDLCALGAEYSALDGKIIAHLAP